MAKRETKRQRSANYPSMDLSWAEDVIKRAHNQGVINRTALAQLVGHRDDTSGPARSRLAALKHFGLVEYHEGEVIITELGKKIAAPMLDEDVSEALRQSFFNVSVFKQIYDLCVKGVTLPKDTLVNTAIRQASIAARAAPEFVDIFARSGARVGLVNEVDDKSIRIIKEAVPPKKPSEQETGKEVPSRPPPPPAASTLGLQSLTINLQLTLPETTDSAVYEEIFKAMKKHLLGSGE